MTSRFLTIAAPPGKWILASAWAAVVHVVFQLTAIVLIDERNSGWSVATIAQTALTAILGAGAFRRNIFALTLLALFGCWRALQLLATLVRLSNSTTDPMSGVILLELGVTIPIALLWITGGVSALRTGRMATAPG